MVWSLGRPLPGPTLLRGLDRLLGLCYSQQVSLFDDEELKDVVGDV